MQLAPCSPGLLGCCHFSRTEHQTLGCLSPLGTPRGLLGARFGDATIASPALAGLSPGLLSLRHSPSASLEDMLAGFCEVVRDAEASPQSGSGGQHPHHFLAPAAGGGSSHPLYGGRDATSAGAPPLLNSNLLLASRLGFGLPMGGSSHGSEAPGALVYPPAFTSLGLSPLKPPPALPPAPPLRLNLRADSGPSTSGTPSLSAAFDSVVGNGRDTADSRAEGSRVMRPASAGGDAEEAAFDLEFLEANGYFDMPIQQAAAELGVGVTTLKKVCRRHDIGRWPFRKRCSLNRLIEKTKQYFRTDPEQCADAVAKLEAQRSVLKERQGQDLPVAVKRFRQSIFKLDYKVKKVARGRGTTKVMAALEVGALVGGSTLRQLDRVNPTAAHALSH